MKKNLARKLIAAKAEEALAERLPVDQRTLRVIGKLLEPKNLKRIAIVAVGGSAGLSLMSSIGESRMVRAAVKRELKKQLEPISKKLTELEAQNAQLQKQNEQLQKQLKESEHGLHR